MPTGTPHAWLLANTVSVENAFRDNYVRDTYPLLLSSAPVDENSPPHVRNAAGLALKNTWTAASTEYANRRMNLSNEAKTKIKNDAHLTLGSSSQKAGAFTSRAVAAITSVELPVGHRGDLTEISLGFINTGTNVNLRIATLQTIGFTCGSIKPEILTLDEILTAVIHAARKDEPSQEVQLAVIHTLYNSLEFVRDNFEREVVYEATQNSAVTVQLTVVGMKHPDKRAVAGGQIFVDRLSTVRRRQISPSRRKRRMNIRVGQSHFTGDCPVLLLLLTKQEELAEEDEWNVSMAAGTCLSLLAGAVQDAIVPAVIPFIEAHIKSTDWHHREAAVITFGSILEGPDPIVLTPFVTQALPLLIDMMSDTNADVKDTVAWTLGRICDLLIQTIKPDVHLTRL
ncbi:armadillo-type protein [Mycena polygramma]|nr:armadillo-type protein [Mycena polygramma]